MKEGKITNEISTEHCLMFSVHPFFYIKKNEFIRKTLTSDKKHSIARGDTTRYNMQKKNISRQKFLTQTISVFLIEGFFTLVFSLRKKNHFSRMHFGRIFLDVAFICVANQGFIIMLIRRPVRLL